MDTLSKIVERIQRRLDHVGLSANAASLKAKLSAGAIYNLQRGASGRIATKGANMTTLGALAPVLKTTVGWLASGEGPEDPEEADDHIDSSKILSESPGAAEKKQARVVGYVGAGSRAHYYAIAQEDFETVEAPTGSSDQTVAVEIRGKSFGPLLDSWLVFYDDVRSPIGPDLYGQICVVGLADDRILLKKIKRESDGSFTLLSNSNEKPIHNAEIEWAAKVTDMKPRD